MLYKYPGIPDENFEVKCWVDGEPTEAKVWLNKTGKVRYSAPDTPDSALLISSQYVMGGGQTNRVPLVFDTAVR